MSDVVYPIFDRLIDAIEFFAEAITHEDFETAEEAAAIAFEEYEHRQGRAT
jgi:hypothetical protein